MRVLDREFQGTVRFRTVEHLEPEAVEAVAHYGWNSHGMVAWRGLRLVYRAGDHRVNAHELHERLRDELALPYDCRPLVTTGPAP
ncbi:MAG: hypothetical protein JNJ54_00945 [Myxococcaceae bacterium]|nr:hypothetical protein [Myxococcaceae bacterium]